MIPANPGLVARYEYEDLEGNISPTYRRVEAWDGCGKALVARSDGHLVRADSFPNFAAIAEGGTYRLIPPDEPEGPDTLRPVR